MNLYPVAIVENFYEDPDAVRAFALKQKYEFVTDKKMHLMFTRVPER